MMSLAAMLNPMEDRGLLSPASTRATTESTPEPGPPAKKPKLAKDAPIFAKGKPVGRINYPPFEDFNFRELQDMAAYNIFPRLGTITRYPRHIPYSSDKKGFHQKTGREAFEVFQYTFKIPSEDRTHTVMWDYNVGLVRITPFFKCSHYAKTIPGKMLNQNPGLKDICHSITGGALAAQGYWMPYVAAKAMAATFCYPIRFALLPIFGSDFAMSCIEPHHKNYQLMVIDRAIIERCASETLNSKAVTPASPAPSAASADTAPHFTEPRYIVSSSACDERRLDYVRRRWKSPYQLDLERRNGLVSPAPTTYAGSLRSDPTATTGQAAIPRSFAALRPPSPRTLEASEALIAACQAPRNTPTLPDSSDSEISPKTMCRPSLLLEEYDSLSESRVTVLDATYDNQVREGEDHGCNFKAQEIKAAWMLWQLHMADTSLKQHQESQAPAPHSRKRRASV